MRLASALALCVMGCTSDEGSALGGGAEQGVGGQDSGVMSGADAAPEAGASVARWDWAGIIGTGQSLSVGAQAQAVASTAQPFGNLKLVLPPNPLPFDPAAAGFSTAPLVEPIRPFASTYPSAYPINIYGETPHTAMANQISASSTAAGQPPYVSVHSVIGENGQGMSVLRKGAAEVVASATSTGRAYAATEYEVAALTRLAREQGLSYGVGALIVTHGESDAG